MPAYKDEKTGKWYATFYYTDWTGKKTRKLKRGFYTKTEAKKYEAKFISMNKFPIDVTFDTFVEMYFRDKQPDLKEKTLWNKKYIIENHILPAFGCKKINEIAPADIIAWQNDIRSSNGFAETYLRQIQNQLSAIFKHAETIYGLENPAKKVKKMGVSNKPSIEFWTAEEYGRFIETIDKTDRNFFIFECLAWTGLRLGELLALTKADIDLENREISVSKTLFRRGGRDIITAPKTKSSVRRISIPVFLRDELAEYLGSLGRKFPEDKRIFPVSERAVEKQIHRHAEMAGLEHIRVHDLRHSHVAFLIEQNVDPFVIKERLGHQDIRMTLNTYGHLYPGRQQKISDIIDLFHEGSAEGGEDPA